jgi:hypothetical protein
LAIRIFFLFLIPEQASPQNNMKKLLLPFIAFSLFNTAIHAQYDAGSFCNTGHGGATTFATDYQATGINPANLGWDWKYSKKKFAMGFAEVTSSIYSDALSKSDLRSAALDMAGGGNKFTVQQKRDAAQNFAEAGLTFNMNVGSFGAAFTDKHAGGFAFRISDNFQAYSKLGTTTADLLFLGKVSSVFDSVKIVNSLGDTSQIRNYANMSPDSINMVVSGYTNAPQQLARILKGTEMTFTWTREYNFSYGRRIFGDSLFALFGGIGFKYVQGLAYVDVKSDGQTLSGYTSITPAFNIDYGTAAAQAHQIKQSGALPKTVGQGYGLDFGVNVIIKNRLKIGAALINAGSITWNGNVYKVKDTLLYSTSNADLNNYNVFAQMKDIFGAKGLLKMEGQQQIKQALPGVFRAGASFVFGKVAELGVDCIFPLDPNVPGQMKKPMIGFGGDIMPVKWVKFQAGFITGGNYKFSIPLGIIFVAKNGTYEAGVASRDAITFFTQHGPTISLSTGFMRFRF